MAPPNESLTTATKSLTIEKAGDIAVSALSFLASDEERLIRFFELTGLSPQDVRQQAKEHSFQASILAYLMSDESLLLIFCAHSGLNPAEIAPAHRALDPDADSWT